MMIPWPFVTQGAMPVHVYDSDAIDVFGDENLFCFREEADGSYVLPVNGMSYPAKITQELRTNGGFDPGDGMYAVYCPVSGDDCEVSITFEMPATGRAYVNIHLDYGVKGPMTDVNPVDGMLDRYDMGTSICAGDATYYDAFVNTALPASDPAYEFTPVGLATCTQYPFDHTTDTCLGQGNPLCSGADLVENINVFKKFAGIATNVTADGGPWGKVPIRIWQNNKKLLEVGTTDEDGYYAFRYKHTGKPASYVVTLGAPVNAEVTLQLKGNGWATATYAYDTETQTGTWFTDSK
jgi:hypothetical protein